MRAGCAMAVQRNAALQFHNAGAPVGRGVAERALVCKSPRYGSTFTVAWRIAGAIK